VILLPIGMKDKLQCPECRFYRAYCYDCGKDFLNLIEVCPDCGKKTRRKCKVSSESTWGNCKLFKRRFPEGMIIPEFIE